jgi:hypothetical protein
MRFEQGDASGAASGPSQLAGRSDKIFSGSDNTISARTNEHERCNIRTTRRQRWSNCIAERRVVDCLRTISDVGKERQWTIKYDM